MRIPRVYLEEGLGPDGTARLDHEESHHLLRVLRARSGDAVVAFDGRGGEWEARVQEIDRGVATLAVGRPTGRRSESPIAVTLVQALVRPERLEYILQKGTEIGIAAFVTVPCERAEAPAPSTARMTRYRRVLLEACKQSGRLVLPTLTDGTWPPDPSPTIVLDPSGAPIGAFLSRGRASAVAIAIGPEGGFTGEEVEALRARGAFPASLGPRILRTETAGVVAASLVLHAWGDLGAI